ncbi:methyltransferase domain-containing protein [Lyngbya sp. PCC 8106]|uniref:methyltransferase domain-containing protein n=1 Tax=Lyngbya sp. (strain PCC 8106) TaxID=313612 RepID=UPI0000EA89F4|nr:methyltransferase domain-containing protein [Lyngbya sp. PCC 8106]EAW37235.1 hypothetical protein L8106_11182 [Lyngbya sp. PCC 8106]
MTQSQFTAADRTAFYSQEERLYNGFGSEGGMIRWGYFDNLATADTKDFLTACQRWNHYLLEKSGIDVNSKVLVISFNHHNTAIGLAEQIKCKVVSVDLSDYSTPSTPITVQDQDNLSFHQASVTELPFPDNSFTHVLSSATFYRIREKEKALQEVCRVLQDNGNLILDDWVKKNTAMSDSNRDFMENLIGFHSNFSSKSYPQFFNQLGLMVFETVEFSEHLKKSYDLLSQMAVDKYPELSSAYQKISAAISNDEMEWYFYQCEKVRDRLSWIHEDKDTDQIQKRYDAWSSLYEAELRQSWEIMPNNAANILEKLQPNYHISILDAGAGTGIVGEALQQKGYKNVTAIDISSKMLKIAQEKQVYTALHQVNLEEKIVCLNVESFDAILAIGVFTYGHASPTGLYHLLPLLKKDGIFILTVRLSNQPMQEAFKQLPWRLIEQQEYMFEGAPFYIMAYQKN